MDRKNIIALPHAHLRQTSMSVEAITSEIKELVFDMEQATLDWEDHREHELGVALAAVQVDRLYRVVVVRNDFEDRKNRTFFALVNPVIAKAEGKIESDYEGCLSVKQVYGLVPRHHSVTITGLNLEGKTVTIKAEGFLARVLQHEVDHTNGVLFIDRIKDTDVFFKLNKKGELEKVSHAAIRKSSILW